MRRLAVLLALAALGAGGCGGGDDDTTTGATSGGGSGSSELARRTLVSSAIDGRRLVDGTQVTLRFGGESLAASAGCNTIVGRYELAGGRLRWASDPSMTELGCEPPLHAQDEWLAGFLDGAGAAATLAADGTLVLARDGVELTLRDGSREHPPLPVVGTYWTLETIADAGPDGTATSVPAGVRAPTLRFTDDDQLVLFAGCNSGGGRAVVRDGAAEIGPLTLTRIACGRAARELERTVTSILAGRVALRSRSAGTLVVSKAGRELVFRAG